MQNRIVSLPDSPLTHSGSVLIDSPRIGPPHEQVVPRDVKTHTGETEPENWNVLRKDSPEQEGVTTMSSNTTPPYKGFKWEFPRMNYIRENPEKLLKTNILRYLCIAAELDIIANIEKYLVEVFETL